MRRLIFLSTLFSGILATNELVGYESCNDGQQQKIKDAFDHAKRIFDVIRDSQIDWNSAAAVEFLGPPGFNQNMQSVIQGEQARIQAIIHDVAKVNGGSLHDDFKINVRCDDWDRGCGSRTFAYTTQRGPPNSGYDTGSINFCPRFFGDPTLDELVERGKKEYDWVRKYNMDKYTDATAVTLIHELFHVDWVANAGRYGPNEYIKDYKIEFHDNDDQGRRVGPYTVYGARLAKTLARWNDRSTEPQPGRIIARSAENLALYALAQYLTQQLGAYPHLPIVNNWPDKEPNFHNENAFEIDSAGNVYGNETYQVPDVELPLTGDQDRIETVLIESLHEQSTYPQGYLDQWHHWANPLTQSSNFHNQLHDGYINTATMQQSTWSNHDVEAKVGTSIGVFDGWVKFWSSSCPNVEATFMWEASYGDVYLKSDGYLHDSSDNRIGTIKIDC